jgi:hypothetical protein
MSAEAWPRRLVIGPNQDRFSRALAALLDFILPQIEALLGAARGTDIPQAHELA